MALLGRGSSSESGYGQIGEGPAKRSQRFRQNQRVPVSALLKKLRNRLIPTLTRTCAPLSIGEIGSLGALGSKMWVTERWQATFSTKSEGSGQRVAKTASKSINWDSNTYRCAVIHRRDRPLGCAWLKNVGDISMVPSGALREQDFV